MSARRRILPLSIRRNRRETVLALESLEGRAVPAVVAAPMSVSIPEGQARQVSFRLTKAPTADVTFTLQSSNSAEATVDRSSLTFTPLNWKTPQFVMVSAVEDFVKDGNKSLKIITGATSSADRNYAGKTVRDPSVKTLDSRKLRPIDQALYQGEYSGAFTGARASGPIEATISGRTISVSILITAPAVGLDDSPASGSGRIADDGTFLFLGQGSMPGVTFQGRIQVDANGGVSAVGTWKYRTIASGTWRIDRISPPDAVVDPPVA